MSSGYYYVYILASKRNGTLYIGVTNSLERRYFEHKNKINDSFSKKYDVHSLVYYEEYINIENAIKREKQLKNGKENGKLNL